MQMANSETEARYSKRIRMGDVIHTLPVCHLAFHRMPRKLSKCK